MEVDFSFLRQPVFWTALGVLVALTTFLINNLKGRPLWHRRMQKLLDRERTFYDSLSVALPVPDADSEEGLAQRYFDDIENGVRGIEALSAAERRDKARELRELVKELRATHQTLVTALAHFSGTNAKQFIQGWPEVEETLQSNYDSGQIPSDAHTHCTNVVDLVGQLTSNQNGESVGFEEIRRLGYSVVVQDRDVVLPMMRWILDRCQMEAKIIGHSLRAGDTRRAIRLKEKYRFDTKHTHSRMKRTLNMMQRLAAEFAALAKG